ncbi:MAG TPA: tetratricopeptide repeat protein [Vicinamibacterales bacterium]|nr:tetratricopeptide repeat protein [Vicinamibacterales bacterium]
MSITLNRSRQVPADETPAFGGIAERFRRAGDLERAVALCRDGLKKFPDHLSARVTLGWSLLDLGRYDEAQVELEQVLKRAPDNLAAIRGLAELHERAENAVVVPLDSPHDQEAVDAAAALETSIAASKAAEAEVAHAGPTLEKVLEKARDKAPEHAPESAPAPPVEAPKKAKAAGRTAPASIEKDPVPPPAPPPVAAAPEPMLAEIVTPEPIPAVPAAVEAAPELVAAEPVLDVPDAAELDLLSKEFGALAAAAPVEAPAVARALEPEPVLDLAEPAVVDPVELPAELFATPEVADAPLAEAAPVASAEPPAIEEAAVIDDFVQPAALAGAEPAAVPELVVDLPAGPEVPTIETADFSTDLADLVLQNPAPADVPHVEAVEPAAAAQAEAAEIAAAEAAILAAETMAAVSAPHPQPDVTDVVAAAPVAEPQVESHHAPVFAADPLVAAPDAHPQPDVSEVAMHPVVPEPPPADLGEHASAWSAANPDFLAAVEASAAAADAAPVEAPPPGVEEFALSGDVPQAAPMADFALMSEPAVEIESAVDQFPALDFVAQAPADYEPPMVEQAGPALDFDTPELVPEPVVPVEHPAPIVQAPPVVEVAPVASAFVAHPVPATQPTPTAPPSPFADIAAAVQQPATVVKAPAKPAGKAAKGGAKGTAKPSAKAVLALEKMLRQINSRRAQVASEYRG